MSAPRLIAVATGAVLLLGGGCGLHPGEAWNRTDGEYAGGGAIGGGASTTTAGGDDATEQSAQGLCPASSTLLAGRHAAGDVCAVPADCVSTCCDCGTGSQSWLAASCVAGRCVDSLTSCNRTNARYCGGGSGVIVAPGAASGPCGRGPATTVCETCIDTSCCAESRACSTNAACSALESCDASCAGDQDCRERCYESGAGGALALQSLDTCVARACGAACEP